MIRSRFLFLNRSIFESSKSSFEDVFAKLSLYVIKSFFFINRVLRWKNTLFTKNKNIHKWKKTWSWSRNMIKKNMKFEFEFSFKSFADTIVKTNAFNKFNLIKQRFKKDLIFDNSKRFSILNKKFFFLQLFFVFEIQKMLTFLCFFHESDNFLPTTWEAFFFPKTSIRKNEFLSHRLSKNE